MLTAKLDSFWSYDYVLYDEAGNSLARLKVSLMGESGTVVLDGMTLDIRRDGLTGPWLARTNGEVTATFVKQSFLSRQFHLTVGSSEYSLQPRAFSNSFDFFAGNQRLGSLELGIFFRRTMTINLPDDLPLTVRALAAWIVILMHKRQSQSG